MINYDKISCVLDSIANTLESSGCLKEAYELDEITDTIEAMAKFSPEAVELAKELGITLTPETASKIVSEYYNPRVEQEMKQEGMVKEAMKLGPRARKLALLAVLLANSFITQVAAEMPKIPDKPVVIELPQFEGRKTGWRIYTPDELKDLKKKDPVSFGIVMKKYYEQQAEKKRVEKVKEDVKKQQKSMPEFPSKKVVDTDLLRDEFGNTGTLITYSDGTKELIGDIVDRGMSLRTRLERSGEIKVDPTAERVKPPSHV